MGGSKNRSGAIQGDLQLALLDCKEPCYPQLNAPSFTGTKRPQTFAKTATANVPAQKVFSLITRWRHGGTTVRTPSQIRAFQWPLFSTVLALQERKGSLQADLPEASQRPRSACGCE